MSARVAESARLGYQAAFDGLRAVAIALVIGFHYFETPRGGELGVDLFFVLSGFLITVLLIEEMRESGSISLRRFYLRRALRLMPALGALIGTFLTVAVAGQALGLNVAAPLSGALRAAVYGLTYTGNVGLIFDTFPREMHHLWSLAVEEQFYVVWPLVLATLAAAVGLRKIALGAAAVATALVTVRWITQPQHLQWGFDVGMVTRFDSILIGCVAGVAFCSAERRRLLLVATRRSVVTVAAVVAVALVLAGELDVTDGTSALFSIAAALLLLSVIDGRGVLGRVAATPPFVFTGRISYALYLWHFPILVWAERTRVMEFAGRTAGVLIALTATVAAATSSYYLVERPFLRLKRRFAGTTSRDVPLAALHSRPPERSPRSLPQAPSGVGDAVAD